MYSFRFIEAGDCVDMDSSSDVVLLNTTFSSCSDDTIELDTGVGGFVDVRYFLNVSVLRGGSGVSGAEVGAFNSSMNFTGTTDGGGFLELNVTSYIEGPDDTIVNNYTYVVSATEGGDSAVNNSVQVRDNNETTLTFSSITDAFPSITSLDFPPNNSIQTLSSIDFNFTVGDDRNVTACSLQSNFTGSYDVVDMIGSGVILTNDSTQYNFTQSLGTGEYLWGVNCSDNASQTTYSDNFSVSVRLPGNLSIANLYPTTDVDVTKDLFFNYSIQIECLLEWCGSVNASLQTTALVPKDAGTPFYTNTANPINGTDVGCLNDMRSGDKCNVTWYVNASGADGTSRTFSAFINTTDELRNLTNISASQTLTISEDVVPTPNAPTNNASSTYVQALTQFTIDWTDADDIDTVFIELNHTGTFINYTMNNVAGDVYNYSLQLPAGTYNWTSYANNRVLTTL